MDDEQGPWWTRPPEPGPRVHLRDEDRDTKTSLQDDETSDPYETEIYRPGSHSPSPEQRDVQPPYAPDTGLPSQGGWPDATPVPQPPSSLTSPRSEAGHDASTMPLPLIEEQGVTSDAPPADSTQPNPLATETPVAPAPAPAPKPKKPQVRRVAAPEPPARPVKQTKPRPVVPADRNAYAPPQNGDIWATFSGPIPLPDEVLAQRGQTPQKKAAAPPPPPPRPEASPRGDDDAPSPLRQFFTVQLPEARFVLIAIAGGLVVLLIVLVALLSGGGGADEAKPKITPTSLAVPQLGKVKAVDASKMLQRADAESGGKVVEAYEWSDQNGKNLIAAIRIPAAKRKTTLKVVHVVGLDGGDPDVRREMTDPDLPACDNGRAGGQASFAKEGMQVVNLDGDGFAEVIVGWSSRCGKASESVAKLALLSNGKKYIVRGTGVLKSGKGSTEPADPEVGKWPTGYYDTVRENYGRMFFPVSE
ncbi:hypothetical protein Kisp01_10360 [Kineosporia sp. NBRC 101677]|uniref:M949_RS01915 family surface polysaccharide biosynthesis protein n=1 Tax=Kineosporia sp. NBRC 101677 TaxID=3032197 RepID=UPI0024A46B5C|nr:hypothetical protein [Kineosporia sp. NBRC 101677]GLY14020.1 hypothetical protein Kisp01_10360 [Kineosporia sp. NBRC 101677]